MIFLGGNEIIWNFKGGYGLKKTAPFMGFDDADDTIPFIDALELEIVVFYRAFLPSPIFAIILIDQ